MCSRDGEDAGGVFAEGCEVTDGGKGTLQLYSTGGAGNELKRSDMRETRLASGQCC